MEYPGGRSEQKVSSQGAENQAMGQKAAGDRTSMAIIFHGRGGMATVAPGSAIEGTRREFEGGGPGFIRLVHGESGGRPHRLPVSLSN